MLFYRIAAQHGKNTLFFFFQKFQLPQTSCSSRGFSAEGYGIDKILQPKKIFSVTGKRCRIGWFSIGIRI